eukprot:m.321950 g.321950  ORF g.321950 m.321950 type:complete len:467 (-) comp20339_c0_seq6:99-1499(-)
MDADKSDDKRPSKTLEKPQLVPLPEQPSFAPLPGDDVFTTAVFPVSDIIHPQPVPQFDYRDFAHPVFFIALIVLGSALSLNFAENPGDAQGILGGILFAAGLTPAVIYSWSFFLGYGLKRGQDALRAATSMCIMAVGIGLNEGRDLYDSFTTGLFEIGALFFIEKFFFLASDDEKIIKALRVELAEALRSPGTGMAMSYFYNFVLPTAACLAPPTQSSTQDSATETAAGDDSVGVDMEKSRGVFEDYTLRTRRLYVFVPRTLDGTDMKKELSAGTRSGVLRMGKPQPPRGADGAHRPMFMYFLRADTEARTCDGMCDFPTIVSSCWDRQQDRRRRNVAERVSAVEDEKGVIRESAFGAVAPTRPRVDTVGRLQRLAKEPLTHALAADEVLEVTIPKELRDFQNALLELVQSHAETRTVVQIVSIPSPPFDFTAIADAISSATFRSPSANPTAAPRAAGDNGDAAAL